MFNPTAPDAAGRIGRAFGKHGLGCACLFPAMHHFALDDARVFAVFEAAAGHGGAVFVHCGVLSVGVRRKLGLPCRFDVRRGNPLDLVPAAAAFPSVPVIIPHFGAGLFRETLMAADLCANIHVDTSSSNGWVKYQAPPLTLDDVFRQALAVLGPERILFGSDSSFFPRGWQRPVWEAQRGVMDALGLDAPGQAAIFAGNFERVFGAAPAEKPVGPFRSGGDAPSVALDQPVVDPVQIACAPRAPGRQRGRSSTRYSGLPRPRRRRGARNRSAVGAGPSGNGSSVFGTAVTAIPCEARRADPPGWRAGPGTRRRPRPARAAAATPRPASRRRTA